MLTMEACQRAWDKFEIPGPRPHPCVFFDQTEVSDIQRLSQIEGTRQYIERQKVLEAARVLRARDLSISRLGWQGGSRWACVNCGTREVEIRRDSPDQGRCLRCGTVNDDTEFRSWWAVEMHSRSLHQIYLLTWAYIFSGDGAFADKAIGIMMQYAEWLPDCPLKEYDEYAGRTHLRFSVDPQLDIRFALLMAYCYDLLYNHSGWSKAMRNTFEQNVLCSTVQLNEKRWPEFQQGNNIYLTGKVMTLAVGLCLGDERMTRAAMCHEKGLLRHLAEDVYPDGFWCESTLNYHLAMVRDLATVSELLHHVGFNLYSLQRYQNMYLAPLRLADLNTGVIPGWGDGPNFSFDLYNPIVIEQAAYEVFYHRTHNREVGRFLAASSARGRMGFGPLFTAGSWKDECEVAIDVTGDLLKEHGIAVLRSKRGDETKHVWLNCLRRIGSHRQAESLELIVHAAGSFVGPKICNCDYAYPLREYYHNSIGHNTVSFPGKQYDFSAGASPAFFAGFKQINIAGAGADGCYAPYKQHRTAILVNGQYIVDFFHVAGEEPTDMDWVWHCVGQLHQPADVESATLENKNGYQFIEDVFRHHTDTMWQATWDLCRPDTGLAPGSGHNPYEDTIDWSASTNDYIVRVKPDGQRVRIYQSNIPYPMPITSPVFASIYYPNTEYSIEDNRPYEKTQAEAKCSASPHSQFRLTMAAHEGTKVYYAAGPGYGWLPAVKIPMVMVRRHLANTTFMTALDAYRDQPYVLSVRSLLNTSQAAAMEVTTRDSREIFVVNYGESPVETDGLYLDGRFAAVSLQDGKPRWVAFAEASKAKIGGLTIHTSDAKQRETFCATLDRHKHWQALTQDKQAITVSIEEEL